MVACLGARGDRAHGLKGGAFWPKRGKVVSAPPAFASTGTLERDVRTSWPRARPAVALADRLPRTTIGRAWGLQLQRRPMPSARRAYGSAAPPCRLGGGRP